MGLKAIALLLSLMGAIVSCSSAGLTTLPNDSLDGPALPYISDEFLYQSQLVFDVLDRWGYDTNTGEAPYTTSMLNWLSSLDPDHDLPTLQMSLYWGLDFPLRDEEPIPIAPVNGLALYKIVHHTNVDVWFLCREMTVTLRESTPGPNLEFLSQFAADLHAAACSEN